MQVPILIISDAPCQSTGLARITRDLATIWCSMPGFRVGTLGLGMVGRSNLPWTQYSLARYPTGQYEFGELTFRQVWQDFCHGEQGIVLTIMDLSRIWWLTQPELLEDKELCDWIMGMRGSGQFKVWSYVPLDSTGPGNKLTTQFRSTLLGIDRILCYTPWAEQVVRRTIGEEEANRRDVTWLPHGINERIFHT